MLIKISAALVVLMLFTCSGLLAGTVTLTGFIGDSDISYQAQSIAPSETASYPIPAGTVYFRVQELYPDTAQQPKYQYDIYCLERLVSRRTHKGRGFGPVSYLVKIPSWGSSASSIEVTNTGSVPVHIISISRLDHTLMQSIENSDDFVLMGLAGFYGGSTHAQNLVNELAANIPTAPGISRGFSTEVPYASWSSSTLQSQINSCLSWAASKGMKFMPFMVSWWAGTPNASDGQGGHYNDVKYQQICWAPNDTTDEGQELRTLLGSRWDIRYCLSVPNQWSSTPWLTMNNPTLNNFKFQKLGSIVSTFATAAKKSSAKVAGICLENEPRYWDTACEAGNPRHLGTLWGDFNPCVLSDAAADGVNLDPSDGLSESERRWLHRNVARYNQKTADRVLAALNTSSYSVPVYTHTLPHMDMYPGGEIAHSGSEFGYAQGARLGIEGALDLTTCERLKGWGPWANVNFEECDGKDINTHLWDVRATYALGAKLYNSYNWDSLGSGNFFGYLNNFVSNLPSVHVSNPPGFMIGTRTRRFQTYWDMQGINRVTTTVELSSEVPDALLLSVRQENDVLEIARVEGPFSAGTHDIEFFFWNAIDVPSLGYRYLDIQAEQSSMNSAITLKNVVIHFDLRRERTQNLLLQMDTTPPTGGIQINNGTLYTSSSAVTLNLAASDNQSALSQMISNISTFSGASWKAYTPSNPWTLASGDGIRTVHVRYRDRAENVSSNYYASIYVDTKIPTTPTTPTGPGTYFSSDPITFRWNAASDTGSGIKGYYCQIGTSPDASDLFDGFVGNVLSKAISVSNGIPCFCRVRAVDKADNSSAWTASSAGTTRVSHVLNSISEAKALANGDSVGLSGKIVTAVFSDGFYIQELHQNAAIKVVPVDGIPANLQIGSAVNVGGSLTVTPNNERCLQGTVSIVSN